MCVQSPDRRANRPPFLYTHAGCAHRTFSFLPQGTYSLKKSSSFPKPNVPVALYTAYASVPMRTLTTFTPPCSAMLTPTPSRRATSFSEGMCPFGVQATVFLGLTEMPTLARPRWRKDTTSYVCYFHRTDADVVQEIELFHTSWLEIFSRARFSTGTSGLQKNACPNAPPCCTPMDRSILRLSPESAGKNTGEWAHISHRNNLATNGVSV